MSTQRLLFGVIFPDFHGFILFPTPRCIGRVFKASRFNIKHAPLNGGICVISGAAKDACRLPVPLVIQKVPFSDLGREGRGSPQPERHRTGVTMITDISVTAERNGKGMNCDARSAAREEKPLPGEGGRGGCDSCEAATGPSSPAGPVSPRGRLGVFQGASGLSTLRAASGTALDGTLNQHSHGHGGIALGAGGNGPRKSLFPAQRLQDEGQQPPWSHGTRHRGLGENKAQSQSPIRESSPG